MRADIEHGESPPQGRTGPTSVRKTTHIETRVPDGAHHLRLGCRPVRPIRSVYPVTLRSAGCLQGAGPFGVHSTADTVSGGRRPGIAVEGDGMTAADRVGGFSPAVPRRVSQPGRSPEGTQTACRARSVNRYSLLIGRHYKQRPETLLPGQDCMNWAGRGPTSRPPDKCTLHLLTNGDTRLRVR